MKGKKQKRAYARTRMAVGLDISSSSIALALLKQDKNGIRVVHAARRALSSGIRENPRALKRTIADLRRVCKVKAVPVTASLFSPRSLMQIVEIPAVIPGHRGQYIQDEIRHYVALAGVNVVSDYRDLPGAASTERMFVVAGDSECVTETVNGCQQGGLDVEVVEPHLLAYIRALYHQRIAGRFGCNVLLALLRDGKLSLVVIRERNIDLVRVHTIKESTEDPEAVLTQLLAEIKVIMQYYEIEVADSMGHWEVNVIADDTPLPEQSQDVLTEGLGQIPLEILRSENILASLSVDLPQGVSADQISAVAVGHAMRVLSEEIVLPTINCLPPLVKEIQEIKRSMLITAVSAAAILLIMGLVTMILIQKGDQVRARIAVSRPNSAVGEALDLRGALETEIEQVGKIPQSLKEILGSQKNVNWARVLADIKEVIPKDVISISRFDSRGDSSVVINGIALTSNDVTMFLNRLTQSAHIDAVELVKTDYKSGLTPHHVYEIECQLRTNTGT